jgi:predicted nucleic acid-binding protein
MPDRLVVSNTSPLLYLHQVGQLDLLRQRYGQVVVPGAVAEELAAGSELGIDAPSLEQHPWLQVKAPPERLLLRALVDLGPGEAEVIAFGLANPGALLLLDDRLARRTAALFGLSVTGTIGVLVGAKRAGALTSVLPVLDALKKTTIRVTDELIRWALEEAGESRPAE